jgi:hypothetical protein
MDSHSLSIPHDENAVKDIDVIEARWSQLDQTAEFYSDRNRSTYYAAFSAPYLCLLCCVLLF